MPTHAGENGRGVGTAVKDVADHAKRVINLELELATMELKRKVAALGIGIGLGIGALIFLVFMLGFAFATVAAALATAMATWLALLIVTGALLLLVGLLGVLALKSITKGTPPVPEQAIREAKLTTDALKSDAT